jgi:hypothetical protein
MAGGQARRGAGVILLRVALFAGLYVIVLLATTTRPMPGVSTAVLEFVITLQELAFLAGLIAPIVAIVGAVLLRSRRQRFTALDWVSLGVGISTVLLPVLFVYAYSDCPNGVC